VREKLGEESLTFLYVENRNPYTAKFIVWELFHFGGLGFSGNPCKMWMQVKRVAFNR